MNQRITALLPIHTLLQCTNTNHFVSETGVYFLNFFLFATWYLPERVSARSSHAVTPTPQTQLLPSSSHNGEPFGRIHQPSGRTHAVSALAMPLLVFTFTSFIPA